MCWAGWVGWADDPEWALLHRDTRVIAPTLARGGHDVKYHIYPTHMSGPGLGIGLAGLGL